MPSVVEFLRHLISANGIIIQFVYGLAFFVLGLAIALQSRHSSRLDLARSLGWLAAFGFVHAFVEWGDLFIPLQAAYLSEQFITSLKYLHLLILGVGHVLRAGLPLSQLRNQGLVICARLMKHLVAVILHQVQRNAFIGCE